MARKLFVGNLSFNTTENELQDTFAQYGTVPRPQVAAAAVVAVVAADPAAVAAAVASEGASPVGKLSRSLHVVFFKRCLWAHAFT